MVLWRSACIAVPRVSIGAFTPERCVGGVGFLDNPGDGDPDLKEGRVDEDVDHASKQAFLGDARRLSWPTNLP